MKSHNVNYALSEPGCDQEAAAYTNPGIVELDDLVHLWNDDFDRFVEDSYYTQHGVGAVRRWYTVTCNIAEDRHG